MADWSGDVPLPHHSSTTTINNNNQVQTYIQELLRIRGEAGHGELLLRVADNGRILIVEASMSSQEWVIHRRSITINALRSLDLLLLLW